MTSKIEGQLAAHLLRADGQEDICLATYRPSTGKERRTALITSVLMPESGDRTVHGNATVFDQYVLRASQLAVAQGEGVVLAHSHPGATSWQFMSGPDRDTEAAYANLVREITGHPLVGMTLAGRTKTWSARHWDLGVGTDVDASQCENVRTIGDRLVVAWNDRLRPAPSFTARQARTVSCWGERVQAEITRLRILVVGLGSVGLDVALRLAATGIQTIGVLDFDGVESKNLDRMIGATRRDVRLRRSKVDVAARIMLDAATGEHFELVRSELSICEPDGLAAALDYDLIISCVDRPWPRSVLNAVAYSDLIPVLDGGIVIDTFDDGTLRNATWRTHVVRPGRPCMSCSRQLDLAEVSLDIAGLLDDPTYLRGAGRPSGGQNVAALSINVAASLLTQLVSFLVGPGGMGEPGPLQYVLSTHTVDHLCAKSRPNCPVEAGCCTGDQRADLTGRHVAAEAARACRRNLSLREKAYQSIDNVLIALQRRLGHRGGSISAGRAYVRP